VTDDVRVITPESGLKLPDLRELRDSWDLVYLLVRRDIAVRYRQTAVGVLWAILQPLAVAGVFSVFLGLLAKVPSQGDIPYPLYVFSGMVMWLYFASAFERTSGSTVSASELISKVYFPRLVIPLVAAIAPLADFLAAFVVLLVVMVLYGYLPGPEIALLPAALLLAFAVALGIGLWMSALNVRYRDVEHVVPFVILTGLFVTPVAYPFGLVPDGVLQAVYALNPLVGVLEVYRWTLFGEMTGDWWLPLVPLGTAILLLLSGALYFTRAERSFADYV
jgi:lipopolysaccharide transport system permease protein